jgi:hypothetical protein
VGRLVVERMSVRYRVPRAEPVPAALRGMLDDVLTDAVNDRLAHALAPLVDTAGDEVVVVRELRTRLVVGRGAGLAAAFGAATARGVAVAVNGGPLALDVRRFRDRADLLTTFVEEVVAGTAARRWYLSSFGAATAAPPSRAVRETMSGSPHALAALASLGRAGRLAWIAAAIDDHECAAIVDALPVSAADDGYADGRTALAGVVRAWPTEARALTTPGRVALFLAGTAAAREGPAARWSVARHRLVRTLAAAAAELATLPSPGDAALADAAAALWRDRTASALPARSVGARDDVPDEAHLDDSVVVTAYGGAFLLLPALLDVAPRAMLESPGARLLVLRQCLGPDAFHDAGVAVAAGAGREAVAPDAARRLSPVALAVLRRFARGLPGFDRASVEHLRRNLLTGAARFVVGPDGCTGALPDVPLRIVLHLAGWAGSRVEVPWLPGGALTFERGA